MADRESIKIYPSLMAADYKHLGQEVDAITHAGADGVHLDIMDGHFVPNLTFGPDLISSIRSVTDIEFDTHLMLSDPADYIEPFVKAGSDAVTIHLEIDGDVASILKSIRDHGVKAGIAIKPRTALGTVSDDLWPLIDRLLIMTVEPGFGGQAFIDCSDKIREAVDIRSQKNLKFDISIDGGINPSTASAPREAGADILISGSGVFKSSAGYAKAMEALR